jgi:tRNA nucleotidyltransferase (CCA-adding enzyme)
MPNKINRVIELAYKAFVPGVKDRKKIDAAAEKAKSFVLEKIKKLKVDADVNFAGSYAKDTWMKDKSDVDIFVSFNSEKETTKLRKLVPKSFASEQGTREYFRGSIRGIGIEVIPLVKFKDVDKVKNSIDLSILHAGYIKRKLNEKLRKDIIILKQFCRANGCYGSETYKHGFSGYSLEVLLIKHNGIIKLFDQVTRWMNVKQGVLVGLDYKVQNENLKVKDRYPNSPIIVIDPTNPKRNICASVDTENFSRFLFAVKSFLVDPKMDFFVERDPVKEALASAKRRGTKLFRYSTKVRGPKDKFLSIYNKNLEKLLNVLKEYNISIYDFLPIYRDDHVELLLQIENIPITKTRRILGPNVALGLESFKRFLKEHKQVYVYGKFAAYDKEYNIKNLNKFIINKIKEYISPESILKN